MFSLPRWLGCPPPLPPTRLSSGLSSAMVSSGDRSLLGRLAPQRHPPHGAASLLASSPLLSPRPGAGAVGYVGSGAWAPFRKHILSSKHTADTQRRPGKCCCMTPIIPSCSGRFPAPSLVP